MKTRKFNKKLLRYFLGQPLRPTWPRNALEAVPSAQLSSTLLNFHSHWAKSVVGPVRPWLATFSFARGPKQQPASRVRRCVLLASHLTDQILRNRPQDPAISRSTTVARVPARTWQGRT